MNTCRGEACLARHLDIRNSIMKIILTADVDTLGNAGDVVEVKDGYARNFLLPRSVALIANEHNMAVYEKVRQQREAQASRAVREAETLAEGLKRFRAMWRLELAKRIAFSDR